MRVLCKEEFIHSNVRCYNQGVTYEITKEEAEVLIALDKKIEMGALSFFTPISEDAVEFFNKKKGNKKKGKAEVKEPAKSKTE